jgi:tetratricopeptide (TPR) repeat protein
MGTSPEEVLGDNPGSLLQPGWSAIPRRKRASAPEARYLLGRTKYNENRFAEAITSFERVLALRPKDVQAEDNLGLSQQGLGHTEQARPPCRPPLIGKTTSRRMHSPISALEPC